MEYSESPAVRNALAWRSREGETVAGKLVDSLAPEVVIARFMSGTASSIRTNSLLISLMMSLISVPTCGWSLDDLAPFRLNSSEEAALANRCPKAWISHLRDLVRLTADSNDVLPRAALE